MRFVVSLALIVCACQSEQVTKPFEPECTVNAFRACELDACKGVQQCADPGVWNPCDCTIVDAAYADAAPDVSADAAPDVSDAADATDATDASDASDAETDGHDE